MVIFQSWDTFFRNASQGAQPGHAYQSPPSLASSVTQVTQSRAPSHALTQGAVDTKIIDDHLAVQAIIRSYQVH